MNYENVVETASETDEDSALTNGGGGGGVEDVLGSPASVPALEASPRVAHALLSSDGSEIREGLQNFHHGWRLCNDSNGRLNNSGEWPHDLVLMRSLWSFRLCDQSLLFGLRMTQRMIQRALELEREGKSRKERTEEEL